MHERQGEPWGTSLKGALGDVLKYLNNSAREDKNAGINKKYTGILGCWDAGIKKGRIE